MKLSGNTVLITGGGSGIGLGLAKAMSAAGNSVIIAGRRESALREATRSCPGIAYRVLDQQNASEIPHFAAQLCRDYRELNVLINNAGIQHVEDLTNGDPSLTEQTMEINFLGPVRLTAALLSHLQSKKQAAVLNVSSALAMLPAASMPSYCASKAALHSYTQSLRFQLRETSVQVIEIIPPWVQTELQGRERGMNPKAMPLADYIDETMSLLREHPDAPEIVVERAKAMRFAEKTDYSTFYARYNEGWWASQAR